jgi:hypothetical protein
MERQKFVEYLGQFPGIYEFEERRQNGSSGVLVKNKDYNTLTFFSEKAISEGELVTLLKHTHHGRNVEWISRVTGYFSKINSWNKGKRAEFEDRHRTSENRLS